MRNSDPAEKPLTGNGAGPPGQAALVIPTLNEEADIRAVVEQLQDQARGRVSHILIVDGGSTDRTWRIAEDLARDDPRIRIVHNPGKLQSAAMNLAADQLGDQVTYLIRADAHARYPADFVAQLLAAADETGSASVVNRLISVGTGCFQRAVAHVSNSRFGTGGAVHRVGGESGYVDHGHHALFRADWYRRVGGYDEAFFTNEDAEFDTRLRQAGGQLWFTNGAPVEYHPRATPAALARQYYRYGRGRAMTRAKHGEALRLRQMIPPLLLLLIAASVLIAPLTAWALIIALGYAAAIIIATAVLAFRTHDRCIFGAALALPIMHLCWGAGFLLQTAGLAGK